MQKHVTTICTITKYRDVLYGPKLHNSLFYQKHMFHVFIWYYHSTHISLIVSVQLRITPMLYHFDNLHHKHANPYNVRVVMTTCFEVCVEISYENFVSFEFYHRNESQELSFNRFFINHSRIQVTNSKKFFPNDYSLWWFHFSKLTSPQHSHVTSCAKRTNFR